MKTNKMTITKSWNKNLQEGLFFLILSSALLWYSLDSYNKAFNKDLAQSPYLFPGLVSLIFVALAFSLIYQGVKQWSANADSEQGKTLNGKGFRQVIIILAISLLYYLAMAILKIPYITFGILTYSLTISNFEVVTMVFLIVMMLYLGVRKVRILVFLPLFITLFLSIAFRAMLHVLLP